MGAALLAGVCALPRSSSLRASIRSIPTLGRALPGARCPLTGNERSSFDTLLPNGLNPQTEDITTGQIAGYMNGLPVARQRHSSAAMQHQPLFQRAHDRSSVTTTVTYGGPDRLAYWSGASTGDDAFSRDSTAADLPSGYSSLQDGALLRPDRRRPGLHGPRD